MASVATTARAPALSPKPPVTDQLVNRLNHELARHLEYPALARRRGWEGIVEVGLRVESNGEISHLQIVTTSGYPTLDHAAQRGLARLERLPGVMHWLNGRHFDIVLPVHYRLLES